MSDNEYEGGANGVGDDYYEPDLELVSSCLS